MCMIAKYFILLNYNLECFMRVQVRYIFSCEKCAVALGRG